jgi:hypothetical protein
MNSLTGINKGAEELSSYPTVCRKPLRWFLANREVRRNSTNDWFSDTAFRRLTTSISLALIVGSAPGWELMCKSADALTNFPAVERSNSTATGSTIVGSQPTQHVQSIASPPLKQENVPLLHIDWAGAVWATATIVSFILLILNLQSGGRVAIETHWGGLGGSLGGIRISSSFIYLMLTVLFVLLWYGTIVGERTGAQLPTGVKLPTNSAPGGGAPKN